LKNSKNVCHQTGAGQTGKGISIPGGQVDQKIIIEVWRCCILKSREPFFGKRDKKDNGSYFSICGIKLRKITPF
jgi:hypothetical protein